MDWGKDMVTIAAFQKWWASPLSPMHIQEAAAAQAREEEARAEAEAEARGAVQIGSIHRSHYNVFELSWGAAQAELSRRGDINDEERQSLVAQKTRASIMWNAWLDVPTRGRRDKIEAVTVALEQMEAEMAMSNIDHDVRANFC